MELVALVRYLAQNIAPGEFLVLIGVVLLIVFFSLKHGFSILTKGKKLINVFSSDSDIDALSNRMDGLVTNEQLSRLSSENKECIEQLTEVVKEELAISRELLSQHVVLKQQHADIFREIHDHVAALSTQIKEMSNHFQSQHTIMKMDLVKNQELVIRVITQIEKIDEIAKAAVPEFRSSFKDIINDLKNLERDMALIERTQQMQINSSSIKLK